MHPLIQRVADIIDSSAPYEKKLKEVSLYLATISQINENNKKIIDALNDKLLLSAFTAAPKGMSIDINELYKESSHHYECDTTLLIRAVEKNYKEIAEKLLAAGADVNACNHDRYSGGYTPLIVAASGGQLEMAQILVKHKANIDATTDYQGYSALMLASRNGYSDVVSFLMNIGANVHMRSHHLQDGCYYNSSALDFVKENGHKDIVNLFAPTVKKPGLFMTPPLNNQSEVKCETNQKLGNN